MTESHARDRQRLIQLDPWQERGCGLRLRHHLDEGQRWLGNRYLLQVAKAGMSEIPFSFLFSSSLLLSFSHAPTTSVRPSSFLLKELLQIQRVAFHPSTRAAQHRCSPGVFVMCIPGWWEFREGKIFDNSLQKVQTWPGASGAGHRNPLQNEVPFTLPA
jgi:hypothetical protein